MSAPTKRLALFTAFVAACLAVTARPHESWGADDAKLVPVTNPVTSPVPPSTAPPAAVGATPAAQPVGGPAFNVAWQEHFDKSLDWLDPFDHGAQTLARVYSVHHDGDVSFLHARHDCTVSGRPPAMHYGHAFTRGAPPLEKVRALKWKWRAIRQPNVDDDGWEDMAAGVYVVMKTPSLFVGGKGFKFGWLARPGERGTHQHGLLQVQLRTDPVGSGWKSESVDLCALFRREYGKCEGEHVLYVGVVSDADGTKSVAEADYADFEIDVSP